MATYMLASTNNHFDTLARDVPSTFAGAMSGTTQHDYTDVQLLAENSTSNDYHIGPAINNDQQADLLGLLRPNSSSFSGSVDERFQANSHMEDVPDTSLTDINPVSAMSASEMSLNPEEMKGYAQLVFPDGEYLVTSTEIMLGRDERAAQILKEQEKRVRREQREQAFRQARIQSRAEATRALDDTREALEGRPAPGLPSTFSETGGIVNYDGSVDGMRQKRSNRRSLLISRSSSTNSVAPASLHVYGAAASPWRSNEESKCIFLPIHPFQAEDIRKISKEHLRIFYDGIDKHWKMEIKGNGAFILNELYQEKTVEPESGTEEATPRHFKRGDTVILTHNTEVLVTSLTFVFKLPHRKGMSTFDDSDNEAVSDSDESQRQAVDVSSDNDSETDAEQGDKAQAQLKRPKITLKAPRPTVIEEHAAVPPGMGSKGGKKKPKEPGMVSEQDAPSADQPATPLVFDANSTLQHVPVNELPEKRKGPGRPPKNGLVSKRDEGIIRRKMKEYEKRGERPPPYKDILALVRAENRAKELAAKAVARGEPLPPGAEQFEILPTTELDRTNDSPPQPMPSNSADAVPSTEPTDDFLLDMDGQDSKLPQTSRIYKSPSPMKPKEEYSEEQLKRPTQTYYYILDEILSEDPEDAMELQQIYDKICKKYPFYKYVVESTGWQSSVRHNLKQNERFKPVSKQGKGWLWAIDPAIPLDKEKKKKPTPPPMSRPMHYDQHGMAQNGGAYNNYMQYGQQAYQQPVLGHQSQNTTYTPNGNAPTPVASTSSVNGQVHSQQYPQQSVPQNPILRTTAPPTSRPASNTPQPAVNAQPGSLPPAFQDLVEQIMRFRVEYLSPYGSDQAAFARHERIFKRCVEWISQLHMRQSPEVKFENDEERRVFQILEKMRHRFEEGANPAAPQNRSSTAQSVGQTTITPVPEAGVVSAVQSQQPPLPTGTAVHDAQASSVAAIQSTPETNGTIAPSAQIEQGPMSAKAIAASDEPEVGSEQVAGAKRQAEDDLEAIDRDEKRPKQEEA